MAAAKYTVDILDRNLNYVATLRNLAPITGRTRYHLAFGLPSKQSSTYYGFLDYSHVLSGVGSCTFRVSTKDPAFNALGDILQPYQYHVRVMRNGVAVWQGVIVRNPNRTPYYIDILAQTYLFLLSKVYIQNPDTDGNGSDDCWILSSGTMVDAITYMINNAKADMGAPLTALTLGEIDNPNFPPGMVDDTGAALTGPWKFSTNFTLKFDFQSVLYVLQMLGVYANFDFEINDQMQLNFKSFIGTEQPSMAFVYTKGQPQKSNLTNYNTPLWGDKMVNHLTGIAADNNENVIQSAQQDPGSIALNGRLMAVAAYNDVKNASLLATRTSQELALIKTADQELYIEPNDRAYPIGQYSIGDTVSINISDGPLVQEQAYRRIVGISVNVQATGMEFVQVSTNRPRFDQIINGTP